MLKTLLSMFSRRKKVEPQANKRNRPTKAQEKRREPSVPSKNDVRTDTSSEIYLNPLHPLNPNSPAHLLDDSIDDICVKPDSRKAYYQDTYKETYRSNDHNETRRSYSEPASDTGYRGGDSSPSDSGSSGGDGGGGD